MSWGRGLPGCLCGMHLPFVEHMCYTLIMHKVLKAVEDFLNPAPPPENPGIDWDVSPEVINHVIWAYANLADCSYAEAIDQLSYMSLADAKEFLGEG